MSGNVTLRFSDISELDSAVSQLAAASSKTVREVLPAQMRLLAADLAFNTRPIGNTAAAQRAGQDRVVKRISSIYKSVGTMAELLGDKEDRLKKAFISMIKKRDYIRAAKLIGDLLGYRITVGEFDGGDLHKKQQFTKHVTERMVVVNYTKVVQYTRAKLKLVGFAKGGFATAARELGGVRGIPGFATRQASPGSGSVTGDDRNLTVTMTNDVRYIAEALDAHGEDRAIEHRKQAVDSVIQRIMDRKLKSASRHLS